MNDMGIVKWESPKKLKQPKEVHEFLNVTPQAIASCFIEEEVQ